MNEVVSRRLKVIVERAVRPVQATQARKRRMREELLAHLASIFDEESERLGDEESALECVAQRFGDPRELTHQLQRVVPRRDRFLTLFEAFDPRPGQSWLHLALKHVLTTFTAYAVAIAGALPWMIFRGRHYEIPAALWAVFVVAVVSTLLYVPLALVPYRIGRLLYGNGSERSLRKAASYGLASLAFFPAMAFGAYWGGTFDLPASLAHLRFACLFAPAAPIVLFAMARQAFDDMAYKEEWASLEIDS